MSVENKIRELLDRADQKQQLTEESKEDLTTHSMSDAGAMASMKMSRDTSKAGKAAVVGDTTMPKQGSSQDASFTEMDEDEPNLGSKSAASVSKDTSLPTSKGDAKSVKVAAMEQEEVDNDLLSEVEEEEEVDIQGQLNSIFGEELSEEFKIKASSIFEAAVIARVNSEMDKVTAKLEEQNVEQLAEFKETIVEKVDSYLNYIVEQWMEENQLAVESGLRTEIAEEFMSGLKVLFKEHYIDVPEEKYDVLGELQAKAEELEDKLNEAIESNIAASRELMELKAAKVIEEHTKGLADTEVEKLKKLLEGVDFENEELFSEKVMVIKENYFPKAPKNSPEKTLVEDSIGNSKFSENDTMSRYMSAISRTVKTR